MLSFLTTGLPVYNLQHRAQLSGAVPVSRQRCKTQEPVSEHTTSFPPFDVFDTAHNCFLSDQFKCHQFWLMNRKCIKDANVRIMFIFGPNAK